MSVCVCVCGGEVLMTALSPVPLTRQNRGWRARRGSNLQLGARLAEFKLARSWRLLIAAPPRERHLRVDRRTMSRRARWKRAAGMEIAEHRLLTCRCVRKNSSGGAF